MQKIILGTVQMGLPYGINNQTGKPNQSQAFDILKYAYQQNIKTLDTADVYGNASEIIGAYQNAHTHVFQINTKFHHSSDKSLNSQLEASLQKLGVEYIDTYFYHKFNDFVEFPALSQTLVELKAQGKIKKVGLSIYTNEELQTAIDSKVIDVIQLPFNLLDNIAQRGELMKEAKRQNKELQVRSIFLQGLFFKNLQELPAHLQPLKKHLQQIQQLTDEYQLSMHSLALNYALHTPEIDYVLFGVETLEQLQSNIKNITVTFDPELYKKVSDIIVKDTSLLNPVNWK